MVKGRGASGQGSGRRGDRPRPLRRTPRGGSALTATPPRSRLTSRAAVLVLVVVALAVSYTSSLRAYIEQRDHLSSLRDSIASSKESITALEREKRRWRDDAYVVAQARARFAFGFPGEIGYRVIGADGEPLDHEDSLSDPVAFEDPDPEWWQITLDSIDTAGNPPRESSGPADKITAPPRRERDR